jgi:hypothetical protein
MKQTEYKVKIVLGAFLLGMLLTSLYVPSSLGYESEGEIIKVSPDGKGYIQEISEGKYLLHMEGTPYEMGYQQGFLDPYSVASICNPDWMFHIVYSRIPVSDPDMKRAIFMQVLDYNRLSSEVGSVISTEILMELSAKPDDDLYTLVYKVLEIAQLLAIHNSQYTPPEFLEEMRGVADGCSDAGYPVSYHDVLLLNMGMDAMLTILYPIMIDLIAQSHSCAGFIAQGEATKNGHTIMGRHWQFTPVILSETFKVMEYVPNRGNRFIATSSAGFVGVTSGMNEKGLGIGMNSVVSADVDPANYGMGVILMTRYIMQYCNQLGEAIDFISNTLRGCSWNIGIGDGRNGQTGAEENEL